MFWIFWNSNKVPNCYLDVSKKYDISIENFQKIRSLKPKYMIFDAMKKWPEELDEKYDLITIFGVFGLSKNAEEYIESFSFMKKAVKNTGVILGANWVRSEKFISEGNSDNRYLSKDLIEKASNRFGYEILNLQEVSISNDESYDKVVIWALKVI